MKRNYYFDDMGGWSSHEPEAVDFSSYEDDHFNRSFEWAADWLMSEWAEFLSKHPHAWTRGEFQTCETCDKLFDQWQENRAN